MLIRHSHRVDMILWHDVKQYKATINLVPKVDKEDILTTGVSSRIHSRGLISVAEQK